MSFPEYTVYLPLTTPPINQIFTTSTPSVSLISRSSNNLVYNSMNGYGLTFTGKSPVGSNQYLAISVPPSIRNVMTPAASTSSMTVCFNVCFTEFLGGGTINIFTQGNKTATGYNKDCIKICVGGDKKPYMNITSENQKSTTIVVNTQMQINTWYLVGYTITRAGANTSVSFFVGANGLPAPNAGKNIATVFAPATSSNASVVYDTSKSSVKFPATMANANIPALLYNDLQLGDGFDNSGRGMNGYVRDFTIFNYAVSNANLQSLASGLPVYNATVPGTAPSLLPETNCFNYITPFQTTLKYYPQPIINIPFNNNTPFSPPTINIPFNNTNFPSAMTMNSSKPLTTDVINGATFSDENNHLNIPVPKTNLLTVSFQLKLNYTNRPTPNLLRILTLANNTTESLSINSSYVSGPNKYLISTTVNNSITNQLGQVNISSITGNDPNNKLISTPSGPVGLQYNSPNSVLVVNNSSDIFTNSNNYIGQPISGPNIPSNTFLTGLTPYTNSTPYKLKETNIYILRISNNFTTIPASSSGTSLTFVVGNSETGKTYVTPATSLIYAPSDTWFLVSLVLSKQNITVYINNSECTTIAIPSGFNYNRIRLGDSLTNAGISFKGCLSNFIVYNYDLSSTLIGNIVSNLSTTCDNYKVYANGNVCSLNGNIYRATGVTGTMGYLPINTPTMWSLVGPVISQPISQFDQSDLSITDIDTDENINTFIDENTTETFVNIKSSTTFVRFARIISITGILFHIILLATRTNYKNVIQNPNVSYALNVLLLIACIVSVIN